MAHERTVLVTGATDGIGLETAVELARRGARVLLHGRSPEKLERAEQTVHRARTGSVAGVLSYDLASLDSVRDMAARLRVELGALDVLLENAGVFRRTREESADGFEITFAVNHLAHVVLAHELLPLLRQSSDPRVVIVSSIAHARGTLDFDDWGYTSGYDGYAAYALSKLANVLFACELAKRLGPSPTVNALHPGVVSTNLLREGFGMSGPDSVAEGAATSVYLALSDAVAGKTGGYWVRKAEARPHDLARDPAITARFYEVSCRLAGVEPLPAAR